MFEKQTKTASGTASEHRLTYGRTRGRHKALLLIAPVILTACTPTAQEEVAAEPTSWVVDLGHPADGLHPIHEGVTVRSNAAAATIEYIRSPSMASGVAVSISDVALEDVRTLSIDASSPRDQRVVVCLTDESGFVWSFPAIKLSEQPGAHELAMQSLRPDPFQNRGVEAPAAFDPETVTMLTLLDITGFMGAPSEPSTWTITRIEGSYQ